jgi:hypothetical protein
MYKATIFLVSFLFFTQYATAQLLPAPTTQWSKCYGGAKTDYFYSMIADYQNGFLLTGIGHSTDGNLNPRDNLISFLMKIDASGGIEWTKRYGNSRSGVSNIVKYPSGGYVLSGTSCGVGNDVTQNKGMCDFWAVRINDTGKIFWQKSYGGSFSDAARKIVIDRANNIYVGGISQSFDGDVKNPKSILPFASSDFWIIKLDSNGNLIWEKSFGGAGDDLFYDMALTPENDLIFCGRVMSTDGDVVGYHPPQPGYFMVDAWVVKIDSSSNIIWQRPFGGSLVDDFYDLEITADSGCVLVGKTSSTDGDVKGHHPQEQPHDAWVVKLDKDGNLEWQKCIGGNRNDDSRAIFIDKEGNYIIQANTSSTIGDITIDTPITNFSKSYLLKLSKNGEQIIWKRSIGGSRDDFFYQILMDKNNSIYAAGETSSNDNDATGNIGGTNGWIMKFNPEIVPIKVLPKSDLLIYPNPAKEAAYIETKNIKEIRLIDALGRVYLNKKIEYTNNTGFTYIPLNYIANGTYLVQAITVNGVVKKGKLVVTK